jgi:hypothetical protein
MAKVIFSLFIGRRRWIYENDIPTKEKTKGKGSWVQSPNEHKSRS